ncbi:ferredoxin-type protein NapF [Thalassotalea agarivorans]|uniref:Ferredoxin-type protein NapF n=1 Tax=Thalassotalea agarivorans TaxID=349064 RepID=A0A1H9ZCT4_THASX|nr:ferredoxin-type protein NapF [Thalassotalea agarivorans]SES79297.1 ferredoxin-type protein NapF [Thalassotalea agarivorans]
MTQAVNFSRRRLFKGKIKADNALRLPWVISEQHFLEHCEQCGKCVDACETSIIKPDIDGFPKVDFSSNECTFCNACIDVCPQPLFKADKSDKPWQALVEINDKCLAKNDIFCLSCQDACEPRAITFDIASSSIPQPTLDTSLCTQCGACVSTCPQDAVSVNQQIPVVEVEAI